MRYVGGATSEEGCIFCNRLAADDDVESLILHRSDRAFVIMNLFPYNTGHLMIVPNAHVASPETADEAATVEMAALRAPLLRALRRALSPEGFNLGLNVGTVAGAGVSDHLHEHVVPRWHGDANFMPILANTMVMPELIPVTYAKVRAELERELRGNDSVLVAAIERDRDRVMLETSRALPLARGHDGEPLWRAALRLARSLSADTPELVGWAGETRAGSGVPVLLLEADFLPDAPATGHTLVSLSDWADAPTALIATARARRGD
jgi:ATP adenylyltransferase